MRAVDVQAVGVDPADEVLDAVEALHGGHLGREPNRAGAERSHDGIGDARLLDADGQSDEVAWSREAVPKADRVADGAGQDSDSHEAQGLELREHLIDEIALQYALL